MYKPKFFIAIVALLCFSTRSWAQVEVSEKHALDKIQNGNTHVVVKRLPFSRSDEFIEVIKKYWTLTKGVDFITADNLDANLIAGDSYISLEQLTAVSSNGNWTTFLYLNLWMPNKKALKNKKINAYREDGLARIMLTPDDIAFFAGRASSTGGHGTMGSGFLETKDMAFDFDGSGYIYQWNPALLKNYLILLSAKLSTGNKESFKDDVTVKPQLELLRNQKLYCLGDNLKRKNFMTGRTNGSGDIKEVFEDYKFPYQSITGQELEKKIFNDTEPFYYLLLTKVAANIKIISVVNSKTGEVIYSRYSTHFAATNLNSGDLKDLYKAINKS